jgi:hypothetical protein
MEKSKLTKTKKTHRGEIKIHKEFLLAGETVNSAYYSEDSQQLHENVQRLRPEL